METPQNTIFRLRSERQEAANHRSESARIIAECNATQNALRSERKARILAIRKEYEGI